MLQAYQELCYSVVVWTLFFWAIYAFFRDHWLNLSSPAEAQREMTWLKTYSWDLIFTSRLLFLLQNHLILAPRPWRIDVSSHKFYRPPFCLHPTQISLKMKPKGYRRFVVVVLQFQTYRKAARIPRRPPLPSGSIRVSSVVSKGFYRSTRRPRLVMSQSLHSGPLSHFFPWNHDRDFLEGDNWVTCRTSHDFSLMFPFD